MAHLTKLKKYDIKDSNIELLGSDLEKRVREHAGDTEEAWNDAGKETGLEVWRIEKFKVVRRPATGEFYDGDSYIVLYTYKTTPDAETLSYDLHFWLGEDTSQDEAGTAAYKTVELDDHLHGVPVQYREVQGNESERFLSYFPQFVTIHGGIETGFRHVSDPVPLDIRILYHITHTANNNLIVRQVPAEAKSLIQGDVYVFDKGEKVLQLNTKESVGKERFKAAEFVRSIIDGRGGQSELMVFDEGSGAGLFLAEFGEGVTLRPAPPKETTPLSLFRISDETGKPSFTQVASASLDALSPQDAFLFDACSQLFVWIGKNASLAERRLAPQYAQRYLYNKEASNFAVPIVTMRQGFETPGFLQAVQA
ncbi:fragmin60 [Cylindrobasidium torrendii FP15055 ss-10]|uniref:Fragmin60 n=1 Tax=Cylindrobasidium torrendii FP15055 ss-10 TaxID=1314674 RepID=A0A0D7AY05_9AGAR|nr:fragmin60 [Cylindrobasidium torrendii FP15055 ss-10]